MNECRKTLENCVCNICSEAGSNPQRFPGRNDLLAYHLFSAHGAFISCPFCYCQFKSSLPCEDFDGKLSKVDERLLHDHTKVHDYLYFCVADKCSRWFREKKEIEKHIDINHARDLKKFRCGNAKCSNLPSFRSQVVLDLHRWFVHKRAYPAGSQCQRVRQEYKRMHDASKRRKEERRRFSSSRSSSGAETPTDARFASNESSGVCDYVTSRKPGRSEAESNLRQKTASKESRKRREPLPPSPERQRVTDRSESRRTKSRRTSRTPMENGSSTPTTADDVMNLPVSTSNPHSDQPTEGQSTSNPSSSTSEDQPVAAKAYESRRKAILEHAIAQPILERWRLNTPRPTLLPQLSRSPVRSIHRNIDAAQTCSLSPVSRCQRTSPTCPQEAVPTRREATSGLSDSAAATEDNHPGPASIPSPRESEPTVLPPPVFKLPQALPVKHAKKSSHSSKCGNGAAAPSAYKSNAAIPPVLGSYIDFSSGSHSGYSLLPGDPSLAPFPRAPSPTPSLASLVSLGFDVERGSPEPECSPPRPLPDSSSTRPSEVTSSSSQPSTSDDVTSPVIICSEQSLAEPSCSKQPELIDLSDDDDRNCLPDNTDMETEELERGHDNDNGVVQDESGESSEDKETGYGSDADLDCCDEAGNARGSEERDEEEAQCRAKKTGPRISSSDRPHNSPTVSPGATNPASNFSHLRTRLEKVCSNAHRVMSMSREASPAAPALHPTTSSAVSQSERVALTTSGVVSEAMTLVSSLNNIVAKSTSVDRGPACVSRDNSGTPIARAISSASLSNSSSERGRLNDREFEAIVTHTNGDQGTASQVPGSECVSASTAREANTGSLAKRLGLKERVDHLLADFQKKSAQVRHDWDKEIASLQHEYDAKLAVELDAMVQELLSRLPVVKQRLSTELTAELSARSAMFAERMVAAEKELKNAVLKVCE